MNSLFDQDEPAPDRKTSDPGTADAGLGLFGDTADDAEPSEKEPFVLSQAPPESPDDTMRKSGLAWSAGIAMFSSIVFMMVLGWFVDLLLGTSPGGLIGGIVLGSLIGFVQLFRISSQIFQK